MSEWWTFYDGDIARVRVEFYRGKAYAHVVFKKWGLGAMREMRRRFPELLKILAAIGYKEAHAFNDQPDAKWHHFVRMLGFREVHRNNGYIVVSRSTSHA